MACAMFPDQGLNLYLFPTPAFPVVEARSLNHWTAREVPRLFTTYYK